jgi:ParB family chromosome partitioning protein
MMLHLEQIGVGRRHRTDMGDIAALAESIRDIGLLHPLVIDPHCQLVAGARRLGAVRELGWTHVPVRMVDSLHDALLALRAEQDENTCRKEFPPSEAVRIGQTLEELEKAQAKERQKAGGRAGGKGSGKLPEAQTGDVRDKVAEAVGMSGRTFEKAKAVVQAAERDPALGAVVEEMDRTRKVDPAFKKVKQRRPNQATKKRPHLYGSLDDATRTALGDHRIGYLKKHIEPLWRISSAVKRVAVVRLLVDETAKDVKVALAMLESGAPPEVGAPTADTSSPAPDNQPEKTSAEGPFLPGFEPLASVPPQAKTSRLPEPAKTHPAPNVAGIPSLAGVAEPERATAIKRFLEELSEEERRDAGQWLLGHPAPGSVSLIAEGLPGVRAWLNITSRGTTLALGTKQRAP